MGRSPLLRPDAASPPPLPLIPPPSAGQGIHHARRRGPLPHRDFWRGAAGAAGHPCTRQLLGPCTRCPRAAIRSIVHVLCVHRVSCCPSSSCTHGLGLVATGFHAASSSLCLCTPAVLQLADELREIGAEYGTTTGRPRRIGWLDMVALKYASRINGLTHINLTKLDVLSELEEIKVQLAQMPNKTQSGWAAPSACWSRLAYPTLAALALSSRATLNGPPRLAWRTRRRTARYYPRCPRTWTCWSSARRVTVLHEQRHLVGGLELSERQPAACSRAMMRSPLTLQVVYETLPGWKQDISKVRRWEDLPESARK